MGEQVTLLTVQCLLIVRDGLKIIVAVLGTQNI